MAFSFSPEEPVLYFGPRRHARWSSREFLLWPAWAYRVVAPRVRQRPLNVLQRAVMGLCQAGVVRVEKLAEYLSIHPDLAAFIVAELTEFGFLDSGGAPTKSGLRVLQEDSLETHEMVAGYVFQDPWKGDLWPRFVEGLDYRELEYNDAGFPRLLLGTAGKPRTYRAYTVLPRSEVAPVTPTASAVVEAVSRHRRGLRFNDASETDDEPIGDFVATGVQISSVSLVEEDPQAVFLTTYLYIPESDSGALDWYVCDPFGLGQSVWLRRRVESVMQQDSRLFDTVNKVVGNTLDLGYEEQREWHETLQLKAGLEVDNRLTVNIRSHSSFEQLLVMEEAHQEVQILAQDCPDRKINEVLLAGRKVLEAVFSSIAVDRPLGDIWERVYVTGNDTRTGDRRLKQQRDRTMLAAIYESAFRAVGFSDIPKPFVDVRPGQIRSVAEYGNHWKLRALVTATALLADRDESHPLREAARQDSQLLSLVDEIATRGGGAGHSNDASVSITDAEDQVNKVYAVVSMLLGLSTAESNDSMETIGGPHG